MKKYTLDELIFFALCLFAFSMIFSVTAVEASLFLILALLLAKKRVDRTLGDIRPALTSHPLFIPWTLYLGVCLLTSITAYYPLKGLGQLNSDLLKYVCLATLLLAVKKEHLPALSRFYVGGAALASLIGLGQVAHIFPSIYDYDPSAVRANALMNAVRFSEVMVLALALAIPKALSPLPSGSRRERFFYGASAAAIFTATIFSQTRGAYLGLAALVVCLFIYGRDFRLRILLLTGVMAAVVAAAAFTNPYIRGRLLTVTKKADSGLNEYGALNTRKELWKTGYKMLKAHPVVGIGPDNVKPLFLTFHPELLEMKRWGSLHSIYVHQAAERGLLGLGALLLLFAAMWRFARERFDAAKSPYPLWALCALPAYYVMNLTEISFQHVHTSFAIFMALAFSAAAGEEKV